MTQPWTLDAAAPSRRRTWTPLVVTQLVVVLAVLVSGLAGAGVLRARDGGGDVLQIVQAASTTAAKQATLRATYAFHISGSGVDVTTKGDMLVDTVRKVSSGTLEVPVLGALSTVSSDGASYVRLPDNRTDTLGHHWLALRLLAPGAPAPVGGQDPLAALQLVSDPKKVEHLGQERIHGVKTEHYRVQLDPARLADSVAKSGLNIQLPPGALDSLKNAGIDLWVDGTNLPRRMRMSFDVASVKADLSFDYLDYGKRFEVTVPVASDVTEVSSVQQFGAILAAAVRH